MCIAAITVCAQLKSEAKENNIGNKSNSGILVWIVLSSLVTLLSYNNSTVVLSIFHKDSTFTPILMYGLIMLQMDYTVYYTLLIDKYIDRVSHAFKLTVLWYSTRLMVILVACRLIPSYESGLYVTCILQGIVLLIFLLLKVRLNKFGISLKDGIVYGMNSYTQEIAMCLIYVFGYGKASASPGYLEAYNVLTLCTDTQWDVLSSGIDTAVTTEVCNKQMKSRKPHILASMLYSLVIWSSSVVMLILYLNIFTNVSAKVVVLMFIFECTGIPLYAIIYCIQAEVVVMYPTVWIGIITAVRYVVRFIVTVAFTTPYSVSMALIASLIAGLLQWLWLYKCMVKKQHKEAI